MASDFQPNIVVINIDDLGYGEIGPYGSSNKTPHLDRMAREGRKLTSHYAAPVCSPSRASLMTGCYPKRVLPISHVLFPDARIGLSPEEQTIAEVLKSAGYATACIGKWHLGDQSEFLPNQQGFDYFYGIPYSNDMGPAADGAKSSFSKPLPVPNTATLKSAQSQKDEAGARGHAQPPIPIMENGKVIGRLRNEEQRLLTREYTRRAIQFIDEHQNGPFFLYLPHTAVHFPFYPSTDFHGTSPNGLRGDWIQEIDASVGEVMNAIRQKDLADKTLVIFTSDNGGPLHQGGDNSPLRGSKSQTFEGGMRVCTMAWWPGKIPAGTSTDEMTAMMDLLPTFASLAGAEKSIQHQIDGVNIWSTLSGSDITPSARDNYFYFRGLTLEAVRLGPWKLHLALGDGPNGRREPLRPQLFHLINDKSEKNDVAAEHPDVVERLLAFAETKKDDLGWTGIGPGCRKLGRVENSRPLIDFDGTVRSDAVGKIIQFP
ncbi:MAG TPA: sulfatase [Planctomicrobium sp.]|nr:sulfatase [Planctomicrobium sp.]